MVFCCSCRSYSKWPSDYGHPIIECKHQQNRITKFDWENRWTEYKAKPSEINAKNDCPWYGRAWWRFWETD
jgi:hypothetical protein